MMDKKCSSLHSCKSWALLVLRVTVGVLFIYHGWGKLFGDAPGMAAFTGMVDKLGFPLPALFAYAAALSEFFGGIAILLGVFMRVATVLVGIVMLVAIIMVKKFGFPAIELDLTLLAMAVALFLMGTGKYSLMSMMKKENADDCCKPEAMEAKK